MRWSLDSAEPARHALLGLLLEGPRHGYDLARRFVPGTALGDVIHLGSSHLYALLGRLERAGLVVGEVQESGSRPARHVYRLTTAGREVVLRWIDEPVARPRDVLLDFPLKLYLARRLDPARAARLIADQRALFDAYLRRLEGEAAELAVNDEDDAFMILVREGRIARTRAALDWLDRCKVAIGSQSGASRADR